jgi:hypothetical protein
MTDTAHSSASTAEDHGLPTAGPHRFMNCGWKKPDEETEEVFGNSS